MQCNANNPCRKVAAHLQAHWTGPYQGQDPKITKQIKICASSAIWQASWHIDLILMIQSRSKFKFGLSCRATTWQQVASKGPPEAIVASEHEFLSGYWESCNCCLLGHGLF
jgi:hypothetical protein